LLARVEVVQQGRVRDAQGARDAAQRRPLGAAFGEDADGAVEDLLPPCDTLRVRAGAAEAIVGGVGGAVARRVDRVADVGGLVFAPHPVSVDR